MNTRKIFSWNSMYNTIIAIKDKYEQLTKQSIVNVPFVEVLKTVNDNFLLKGATYTQLSNSQYSLLLIKYSLLSGIDDIYTNPQSIFREGRSLVIDLQSEEIVLCPFRKFFNLNEIEETSLQNVLKYINNGANLEVSNKLDGSMQAVRYWKGQFIYSGSSALDENNSPQLKSGKKLFFSNNKLQQLVKDFPDYTVIFEALLEDDPHIVHYVGSSLNLIGMRNVYTGQTLSYNELQNIANLYDVPATSIEAHSIFDLLKMQSRFTASDKEGWVIRLTLNKENDLRIKLKCDDYIKIHSLCNGLSSPNAIVKEIANNTFDDSISKVPIGLKSQIIAIKNRIDKFIRIKMQLIEQYYNRVKNIEDKKQFALYVQKNIDKVFQPYMYMIQKSKEINLLEKRTGQYTAYTEINEFLDKYSK